MVINQEAETTSGGYRHVDVGEEHGLDLKACPFENQLFTISYIYYGIGSER